MRMTCLPDAEMARPVGRMPKESPRCVPVNVVRLAERGQEVYVLAGRLVHELEASRAGYLGDTEFLTLKELLGRLGDAIAAATSASDS